MDRGAPKMTTKEEVCRLLAAMSNMRDDGSWTCPPDLQHVIDELNSDTQDQWDFMTTLSEKDLRGVIRSHAEQLADSIAVNNRILMKMKEVIK
jgi:hypothetical protein